MGTHFQDMSIQKKMVLSLLACVMLPMFFVSIFLSHYIVGLHREGQYQSNQNVLSQLGTELDEILAANMEYALKARTNASVQAVVGESAHTMNYRWLSELLTEWSNQYDCVEAVTVSKGDRIVFQRGKHYYGERLPAEYAELAIGDTGRSGFWTGPYELTRYRGMAQYQTTVISFYVSVYDFHTMKPAGALSFHINVDALTEKYLPYLTGISMGSVLVDSSGITLSSEVPEAIGLPSALFQYFTGDSGYRHIRYQKRPAILYAARLPSVNWRLLNVQQGSYLIENGIGYTMAGLLSAILFGCTFAFIQKKYMIRPIERLTQRMDRVKEGHMEAVPPPACKDEIGKLATDFEDMLSQINLLINQVYLEKIQKQEAERKALLAQMKPHFLYNTLDSIHWLAMRNKDYEVSNQLEALSEIFKTVLNFGYDLLTLEEELDFVSNYMYLMKSRLHEPIQLITDIEEGLLSVTVPKLVLQPLVENAIKHGFETKEAGGKIKIIARRRGEDLLIRVLDNGVGTDQAKIRRTMAQEKEEEAFVLISIDRRLKVRYGDGYGLTFHSKRGLGTMCVLTLKIQPCL